MKLQQLKKETNAKALFRSLKPDGPDPLDFLLRESSATIVEVDPASCRVAWDSPLGFSQGQFSLLNEAIHPTWAESPDPPAPTPTLHPETSAQRRLSPGSFSSKSNRNGALQKSSHLSAQDCDLPLRH